jgi:hypothetical protein
VEIKRLQVINELKFYCIHFIVEIRGTNLSKVLNISTIDPCWVICALGGI